jgi:hypothetical protein
MTFLFSPSSHVIICARELVSGLHTNSLLSTTESFVGIEVRATSTSYFANSRGLFLFEDKE